MHQPQRTQPIGLIVSAVGTLRQLVFPLIAGVVALRDSVSGIWLIALPAAGVIVLALGIAYLSWLRRTYTIGAEDIRVESGIISRTAASVPYERIQDVSLEQKLIPRLFGLVSVKFETGAGGAEELKLAYLTEEQGEDLRILVRGQRAEGSASVADLAGGEEGEDRAKTAGQEETAETLFSMGPARLFTNGLFEFSLAIFAVLIGLAQQFDFLFPFDIWDWKAWGGQLEGQSQAALDLGRDAQVLGGLAALIGLIALGFATGIFRVFTREWGFLLEKTARGFRRRRGLFTKTDVVMPTHRVQAIKLGTRCVR